MQHEQGELDLEIKELSEALNNPEKTKSHNQDTENIVINSIQQILGIKDAAGKSTENKCKLIAYIAGFFYEYQYELFDKITEF